MFYTPHILQKKTVTTEKDDYGRTTATTEEWTDVCRCRCDDNTVTEFSTENGHVYRPQYHVVCEGSHGVKAGEFVRCVRQDGTLRGEGKCERPRSLNYLPYSELWM